MKLNKEMQEKIKELYKNNLMYPYLYGLITYHLTHAKTIEEFIELKKNIIEIDNYKEKLIQEKIKQYFEKKIKEAKK